MNFSMRGAMNFEDKLDPTPLTERWMFLPDILDLLSPYGSRSTIYRLIRQGKFPKPEIIMNRWAWRREDIHGWMDGLGEGNPGGS